jgi:predicted CXXCH cytochrome family protein
MLPEGCGSCHVGHGKAGEPMLAAGEEEFCYQCHGEETERAAMKVSGRLAMSADPVDIKREFQKVSRHPVKEGTGHEPSERLPDVLRGSVNHAECVDCHNPHHRTQAGTRRQGVSGYSLSGQYLDEAVREYEVCLKCHAEKAGLGNASREVLSDFAGSVRSSHPVVQALSAGRSPSLNSSLADGGTLRCSACHTNDDPDGPRGPHGSRHDFLLSGRYDREPNAVESPFAFEFCYSCHDRTSILSNESFGLHREHIQGDPAGNVPGTSCYTCHASHSSRDYPHLIAFNPEAVSADPKTGRLSYVSHGEGRGECYLLCHGHSHAPAEY